mgnify:FL=1
MKKIIALLVCLVLTFGMSVSAAEGAVTVSSECDISDIEVPIETSANNAAIGQTLEIKAKSAILMEPNTGNILYESNSDEVLAPASITKIMSLLLVMEAIDKGMFDLETVISASEHACSMGGSQIWLEPGESMTVDDLLKAAVVASANDATVALGEAVAGSEEGFVAMMNARAKELGMLNTNFVNATGLDAEGHVTTAHDVALMSCELIKHDLIKKYSTVWMDTLRDGKSELVNTNKLVRFYKGTTGLKTGTTSTAGYCLSATAERDGMELVAVVMGGETSPDRFNGAKKLLDYGFANYTFTRIDSGLESGLTVPIANGTAEKAEVKSDGVLNVLLQRTADQNVEREVVFNKNIKAPVKKGEVLGTVNISIGGEPIGEIEITAACDVDKITFGFVLKNLLTGLFKL